MNIEFKNMTTDGNHRKRRQQRGYYCGKQDGKKTITQS